jgi:transcriptional regulator with XRE-family HTH domain
MTPTELKEAREGFELTQEEMAERLGVDPERYAGWESSLEELDSDVRSLLALAIAMIGIGVDFEARKPKVDTALARVREILELGPPKPLNAAPESREKSNNSY